MCSMFPCFLHTYMIIRKYVTVIRSYGLLSCKSPINPLLCFKTPFYDIVNILHTTTPNCLIHIPFHFADCLVHLRPRSTRILSFHGVMDLWEYTQEKLKDSCQATKLTTFADAVRSNSYVARALWSLAFGTLVSRCLFQVRLGCARCGMNQSCNGRGSCFRI